VLEVSRIIGVDIIEAAVLKRPPIVILVISPPVLFRQVQVCFAFRQGLSPAFPAAKVWRPIVVDVEIAPALNHTYRYQWPNKAQNPQIVVS